MQRIYLECMNEEMSRSPMTFPVTTVCLSVPDKKLKDAIQDGIYVKSVDNIELSLEGSVYTISFTIRSIYGDTSQKLKFPFEDFEQ